MGSLHNAIVLRIMDIIQKRNNTSMATISIHAAVIHELKKESHTDDEGSVILMERDNLHESNDLLTRFVEKIDQDSRNANRAASECASFTRTDTFAMVMSDYYTEKGTNLIETNDFLELSKKIVRVLGKKMQGELMAKGGYIPILWYRREDRDYLLIGLVSPSKGFTLDTTGAIIANTNVDNASLRFSASVELGPFNQHWNQIITQDNNSNEVDSTNIDETVIPPSSYVRWTKKKDFIAQYFQNFVPTAIPLNDGDTTKKMINHISKYLDRIIPNDFNGKKDLKYATEQSIYRLMSEKCSSETTVNVEEDILPIFHIMKTSNPSIFPDVENVITFSAFCDDEGYHDYKSVFHPKKDTIDKKLNVKIVVGESIVIRGKKKDIDKTTSIVVEKLNPNDTHYKLMVKLTAEEYSTIIGKNPGIIIED